MTESVPLDVIIVRHVKIVKWLVFAELLYLCLDVSDIIGLVDGHDEAGLAVGLGLTRLILAFALLASVLETNVATEIFGEIHWRLHGDVQLEFVQVAYLVVALDRGDVAAVGLELRDEVIRVRHEEPAAWSHIMLELLHYRNFIFVDADLAPNVELLDGEQVLLVDAKGSTNLRGTHTVGQATAVRFARLYIIKFCLAVDYFIIFSHLLLVELLGQGQFVDVDECGTVPLFVLLEASEIILRFRLLAEQLAGADAPGFD